jgi:hypothetical protein
MNTKDITPKAEPVAWGTAVGLIIAALISYGLNITPELRDALIVVLPVAAGALWARFQVYAPDTVAEVKRDAYAAGLDDAQPVDREAAVTDALNRLSQASGQGARRRSA